MNNNKTLIVYYSHSGNTKSVADQICNILDADILEVETSTPYPSDYSGLSRQAKQERDAGILPDLKPFNIDIRAYSTIFVGTPNWWNTMALPLRAFLMQVDLRNKKVIPFCTHGGGGDGRIFRDIKTVCSGEVIRDGLSVYGRGGSRLNKTIKDWLEKVKP